MPVTLPDLVPCIIEANRELLDIDDREALRTCARIVHKVKGRLEAASAFSAMDTVLGDDDLRIDLCVVVEDHMTLRNLHHILSPTQASEALETRRRTHDKWLRFDSYEQFRAEYLLSYAYCQKLAPGDFYYFLGEMTHFGRLNLILLGQLCACMDQR